MNVFRHFPMIVAAFLAAASVGCIFGPARSPKVPVPPTVRTEPPGEVEEEQSAQTPKPPPPIDTLPAPPKVDPEPVDAIPPPPAGEEAVAPPPPSERTAGTAQPDPSAPEATPAEPPPAPVAVPRLTQLLTEEEKWEHGQVVDQRLQVVHQILAELEKRSLEEDQMELLDRVRAFVKQTTIAREEDLIKARSLARRAELLAKELEETTR